MMSVIYAFGTASRYLTDILNINKIYMYNMVRQIYHMTILLFSG